MSFCPSCTSTILSGAKFCHHCGTSTESSKKNCPSCSVSNPSTSVFCFSCGHGFTDKKASSDSYEVKYSFDFNPDNLMDQIRRQFFSYLRNVVYSEQSPSRYSEILDRFYHTSFLQVYTTRANQLGEKALILWETTGRQALPEIDTLFETSFEGLTDYFLIHFCSDLLKIALPEAVLKYEKLNPNSMTKWAMMNDFLDFKNEPEVFYFDFVTMPEHFMVNACKGFLKAERGERVFFVCDLSFKGNCKDGFAMTDKGIYWKQPFHKAQAVHFKAIQEMTKENGGLKINGHFLTTNPTLDLKLFKLLKKLKKWPVGNFSTAESVG